MQIEILGVVHAADIGETLSVEKDQHGGDLALVPALAAVGLAVELHRRRTRAGGIVSHRRECWPQRRIRAVGIPRLRAARVVGREPYSRRDDRLERGQNHLVDGAGCVVDERVETAVLLVDPVAHHLDIDARVIHHAQPRVGEEAAHVKTILMPDPGHRHGIRKEDAVAGNAGEAHRVVHLAPLRAGGGAAADRPLERAVGVPGGELLSPVAAGPPAVAVDARQPQARRCAGLEEGVVDAILRGRADRPNHAGLLGAIAAAEIGRRTVGGREFHVGPVEGGHAAREPFRRREAGVDESIWPDKREGHGPVGTKGGVEDAAEGCEL